MHVAVIGSGYVGLVAGASLCIYLTHWQVFPLLLGYGRLVAVVGSVAAGIGAWFVARWLMVRIEGVSRPPPFARGRPGGRPSRRRSAGHRNGSSCTG